MNPFCPFSPCSCHYPALCASAVQLLHSREKQKQAQQEKQKERCGCNGGCLKATGNLNEGTNFCVQFRKYSPAKPPITIPCFDAVETHVPRHEPTIPPNKAFRKVVFDKEQSSSGLEYSVQRIRCMIEPIEDEL